MKNISLAITAVLFALPVVGYCAERLVPAGSLISCTVTDPRFSSKTANVGDPVLCKVGYTERYGRFTFPYGSFLEGRLEDYKDPGHFVGKGWMELVFDRMIIEPNIVVPMNAKVVDVPGLRTDKAGRIVGKGHAVRDTVSWMVPFLWPVDAINLPRRGPRPTLKAETRLTVKVMEDFVIPLTRTIEQSSPALIERAPAAYTPSRPAVQQWGLNAVPEQPSQFTEIAPRRYLYFRDPGRLTSSLDPPRPVSRYRMPYAGPDSAEPVTLLFNDGRPPEQVRNYVLTPTRLYVLDEKRHEIAVSELDLAATERVNREAGIEFRLPNG